MAPNCTECSAVDIAQGWIAANPAQANVCRYALAIAIGEGNLQTGPGGRGFTPGKDIYSTDAFLLPTLQSSGGPWQVQASVQTCTGDDVTINCYARDAQTYILSSCTAEMFASHQYYDLDYIFSGGVGGWCGCHKLGTQTIGWSGNCQSDHIVDNSGREDYYQVRFKGNCESATVLCV